MQLKQEIAPATIAVGTINTPVGERSAMILGVASDPNDPESVIGEVAIHFPDPETALQVAEKWIEDLKEMIAKRDTGLTIATPQDVAGVAAAAKQFAGQ